jgi:hypothetical protein
MAVTSLLWLAVASAFAGGTHYQNFDVASYARVMDVQAMKDPVWLERSWAKVTEYVKFDKIYLETHRDTVLPDQATIEHAKKFFASKGVRVAGGITWTINEHGGETYDYANPEDLARMKQVVEFTAKNFDEILLVTSQDRRISKSALGRFSILLLAFLGCGSSSNWAANTFVFFGSHGPGPKVGFSIAHFDTDTGSSVNPERQTRPRPHSIRVDPSNQFVLVPDLGVDKLFVYRLDQETGALQPNAPPFAKRFLSVTK